MRVAGAKLGDKSDGRGEWRCVWDWKRRDGSGRSMRHIPVGHGLQYQYQDRAQLSSPEPCREASPVENSSVAIPRQSGRKHGYGSLRLVPTSVKTLRRTSRLCRAPQSVTVMCCRRTSSAVTSGSAVQRLVDGAAVSHPSLVGSCSAADAHLLSLARRWHASACDTAQRLLAQSGCPRRQTLRSCVSDAAQQHPTSAGRLVKLSMVPAR